eukprot:826470_1
MKGYLILTIVLGGLITKSFQASKEHVDIALANDTSSDVDGANHSEQTAEIGDTDNQDNLEFSEPVICHQCNDILVPGNPVCLTCDFKNERRSEFWKCPCGCADNYQSEQKCFDCGAERVYPTLVDDFESISTDLKVANGENADDSMG